MHFFVSVILQSKADKIDDANKYIDEVLSVYVPWAVEMFNLKLFEMPNFSYNYQNRSSDGRTSTSKVYYHSGNLTGVENVFRKTCKEPRWNFGNVTVKCDVVFPQMIVKYEARLQAVSPVTNGVRIRGLDFNVTGEITNMEASITVTSSPHMNVPTIKDLTSIDAGKPIFKFGHTEDLSYENLVSHFYHKFNEIFLEVFYVDYRRAFERAVASVPYPFAE